MSRFGFHVLTASKDTRDERFFAVFREIMMWMRSLEKDKRLEGIANNINNNIN